MQRIVYTGTLADGTQLMVERYLDDVGDEARVTAATRPVADRGVVWGPPIHLTREGREW